MFKCLLMSQCNKYINRDIDCVAPEVTPAPVPETTMLNQLQLRAHSSSDRTAGRAGVTTTGPVKSRYSHLLPPRQPPTERHRRRLVKPPLLSQSVAALMSGRVGALLVPSSQPVVAAVIRQQRRRMN